MSEPTDSFTPKEIRFVDEYLVDMNGSKAAIRAGYSKRSARYTARDLLQKPHVAALVKRRQDDRQKRVEADQDYTIARIQETIERCRQAAPVTGKDGMPVLVESPNGLSPAYVFQPRAILTGCNLLMEYHGMKKTRVEHSGPGGVPLAPPSIAISFANGGPGSPVNPEDDGVETS